MAMGVNENVQKPLDRLAEAPGWQAPPPLAGSRSGTLTPRQLPQIAAPQNGSEDLPEAANS